MRKCSVDSLFLLLTLSAILVAGCGKETVNIPQTALPSVTSTTPAQGATAVAASASVSATFSEPMNASTINAGTFKLTGPGGTTVPGTVAYVSTGSVATFTPTVNLGYATAYTATITTGATNQAVPAGALAANYVWTFTTGANPNPIRPTVVSTTPSTGATGVAVNATITATFSEALSAATVNAANFKLTGPGGTAVAGTVAYTAAGLMATFAPAAALAYATLYTATVTTGVTDLAGNALVANYVWTFTTGAAPVTTPQVVATKPLNGAIGVPTNQALTATFSEAMNPTTISGATITLAAPGGSAVAGLVTYVTLGSVATFTPAANLAPGTLYSATINTGAKDLAGNALAANYVWTFTTGAAPDTTKPTVIATTPVTGATGVSVNSSASATFSKAMNAATINVTSFTVSAPGGIPVAGTVTYAVIGNTALFTPTANFEAGKLFTATVTTGAMDLEGNPLASDYVWTFTTGATPDTTPPTIVITVPANGTNGVALNQAISAGFSEAMNPLTITSSTFLVTTEGTPVAGTISYDPVNFIATFLPSASLVASTTYTATVTSGATDLAANPLGPGGVANPWMFTTGTVVVPPPVALGTASLFGAFGGGAGVTNQGTATVINGNLGTTGVSTLITGFHDAGTGCTYTETPLDKGFVNGAIDTAAPPPTVQCPSEGTAITAAIAAQAALDAQTAYTALVAFPNGLDVSTCPGCGGGSAGELGGRTLHAGIYKSAPGTYGITLGDLTLDAQGNPNAFWVFQVATALGVGTPTAHRSVLLINGAQAKNVFWQVGTAATINGILGGGTMTGTIISQAAINISTAGVAAVTTINGRAFCLNGPATMVNTVINVPAP